MLHEKNVLFQICVTGLFSLYVQDLAKPLFRMGHRVLNLFSFALLNIFRFKLLYKEGKGSLNIVCERDTERFSKAFKL